MQQQHTVGGLDTIPQRHVQLAREYRAAERAHLIETLHYCREVINGNRGTQARMRAIGRIDAALAALGEGVL
jgi:hypothetical protein